MKRNQLFALLIYFGAFLLSDLITFILKNPKNLVLLLNFTLSPLLLVITLYLLKDELNKTVFEKRMSTVRQSIGAIIKWFFIAIIGFIVIAIVTPLFYTSDQDNSMKITQAVPLIIIPFVF